MNREIKIILTGATGFFGSNFLSHLLSKNYTVHILKRRSSNLARIKKFTDSVFAYDIDEMNDSELCSVFEGAHSVFHMATCFGRNGESLTDINSANVTLPMRLLEAAQKSNVGTFFNIDTVLPQYLNAYSLSKSHFAEWGRLVSLQKTIRFVNVKIDQIYGPGDDSSKFTAYVIQNCLKNVPALNLTAGLQKREFIYIDDAIEAIAIIMKSLELESCKDEFQFEFEVASDLMAATIREFVELAISITKSHTKPHFGALPYRNNELMMNVSKGESLRQLGWIPKIDLATGIRKIMQASVHSYILEESNLE